MLSVNEIKNKIAPIVKNTNALKMALFGSYAKGTADQNSDIDLFLTSGGAITGLKFFDLKSKLQEAFDAEVDLISDSDVIPDSPIQREINKTGVIIYERKK